MKTFSTTILFLCSTIASGQDLKKIEQNLIIPLSRIATVFNGAYYDTLDRDNETFEKMLSKYLSAVPSTMAYPFSELKKEGLSIATSSDKQLRIYSWDSRMGGSMHIFSNIYQFRVGDKIYAHSANESDKDGDTRGSYSEIFTVDSTNKIYLGLYNSIYSTKDCGNTVKAFKIEKDGLNDSLALIKVDTVVCNELSFGFNFFSVVDRPERPVKLVYYNAKSKTLKIPVIGDNDAVTAEFILYRYNGKYFEGVKK